jgi:ketosteroid isomerase-like protein
MRATYRYLVAGLLVSSLVLGAARAADKDEGARLVAQKIVSALTAAFVVHDGDAFAAEFWPDAEFMNVFGQVVEGQQQIATLHNTVFRGRSRTGSSAWTFERFAS